MGAGPQTRLFRGVACRSPVLCGAFLCSEIHDLKNLHRVPNLFRCVCVCVCVSDAYLLDLAYGLVMRQAKVSRLLC